MLPDLGSAWQCPALCTWQGFPLFLHLPLAEIPEYGEARVTYRLAFVFVGGQHRQVHRKDRKCIYFVFRLVVCKQLSLEAGREFIAKAGKLFTFFRTCWLILASPTCCSTYLHFAAQREAPTTYVPIL